MKVLELFSGTGSVGKVCKEIGWDVTSLDIDIRADINCDILKWDYKSLPKDSFDIIWASPPCENYSSIKNCWLGREIKVDGVMTLYTKEIRDKQRLNSDKHVLKTFEIIKYFNHDFCYVENPQSGDLKNRPFMKDVPFYDVDYCRYCDWGYRKRTRIWTNKENWNNLLCNKDCGNLTPRGTKHRTDPFSNKKTEYFSIKGMTQLDVRHRMPPNLIFSLLQE